MTPTFTTSDFYRYSTSFQPTFLDFPLVFRTSRVHPDLDGAFQKRTRSKNTIFNQKQCNLMTKKCTNHTYLTGGTV